MCRKTSTVIDKVSVMERLQMIGEVDRTLPKFGEIRSVSLGLNKLDDEIDLWEIEQLPNFHPDNKHSYRLTMSSKSGRLIDASIVESHVRKYHAYCALSYSIAMDAIDQIYIASRKLDPSTENHFAFKIVGAVKKLKRSWQSKDTSRIDCVLLAQKYLSDLRNSKTPSQNFIAIGFKSKR